MAELNYRGIVEQAGGRFVAVRGDSVFFTDPESGASLSLYLVACSQENILLSLKEAREKVRDFPPLVPTDSLSF